MVERDAKRLEAGGSLAGLERGRERWAAIEELMVEAEKRECEV